MSTTTSDFLRHLRTLTARQAIGSFSDQQLLDRFRLERSEASFAVLVQRHGPMVLSVCRRVLHNVQDVEDAFQATFLVLAKKAATLRQPPLLSGWLHGVAYHVALRLKAKTQRRTAHEHRVDPPHPSDALDDITWRELRSVLDEELQRLPEKYRAPLVLCYLEAQTQDEAARRLGWSKNTFGRRINQARQMLARRLTRRGLTLPAALTAPLLIDGAATASVPPLLAASTVRAGLALAVGNPASGIVSAQVLALAEGGVGSLLVKKASIALVLLVPLTLGLGGLLAHRTVQDRTCAETPAAPKALPGEPTPPPPAHSASKEQVLLIKGRVLDPGGKPVAGARLLMRSTDAVQEAGTSVRATTDKDGLFRFKATAADFGPQGKTTLAAVAQGFGPDWREIKADNKDDVSLQLVEDDVPIEGRVLDLEGQPIAGVLVRADYVNARTDGSDLTDWLQHQTKKSPIQGFDPPEFKSLLTTGLPFPTTKLTDKDGRFRLTGFGRERIVRLQIEGPGIEKTIRWAATRSGPVGGWVPGHRGLYAAKFDYLAAPCKPIVGTVRDKRTGKPLAGFTVASTGAIRCEAVTDERGRYRIDGVGKSVSYAIETRKMPYFGVRKDGIADTPGLDPLTVDFELTRGLVVRGRLFDKTTGQPVKGSVTYVPLADNPNLKDLQGVDTHFYVGTNVDGRFTVVAVPGPGLLCAQGDPWKSFAPPPKRKAWQTNLYLDGFHVLDAINPSKEDAKSTIHDLALQPGRTRRGTIIGPDGRPVSGCLAVGLEPLYPRQLWNAYPRLKTADFTAHGIRPGCARTLMFVHMENNGFRFAKVCKLSAEQTSKATVRLEPLGELKGRIVDTDGRARSGLHLGMVSMEAALPRDLPPDDRAWETKLIIYAETTDDDGRFHFKQLVPGLKYDLVVPRGGDYWSEKLLRSVTVESGKTKDLGDLKRKQVSDEASGK